jgi:uncharacterized membrane protein
VPEKPDFGPYHHFFYPGADPGAYPGAGLAGPTLVLAAMTLFWLAALTWVLWPWIQSRLRGGTPPAQPAAEPEPTAVELLRQRYVLGQIDAFTFEEMLDHLLGSQVRERDFSLKEARIRGTGWDRQGLPRTEMHTRNEPVTGKAAARSLEDLEPHAHYG